MRLRIVCSLCGRFPGIPTVKTLEKACEENIEMAEIRSSSASLSWPQPGWRASRVSGGTQPVNVRALVGLLHFWVDAET